MNTATQPKFVRWAIMLGIVVTLNLFSFVAINTVFPSPVFEEYCPVKAMTANNEVSCIADGGIWNDSTEVDKQSDPQYKGYCDMYALCQPNYEANRMAHELQMFGIIVVLAVVFIVVGILPLGASIVSTGLSYGGVLMLVIASIRYWDVAGKYGQLAIAAFALIALLYIGIRKFKDA